MHHMETVDAIVGLARTGRQLTTEEALGEVVRLINGMCPTSRNYDARLAVLMQVGAALWNASVASRDQRMEPGRLRSPGPESVPQPARNGADDAAGGGAAIAEEGRCSVWSAPMKSRQRRMRQP